MEKSSVKMEVATECAIPAGQEKTIDGHWPSHPIPIAYQQDAFSPEDLQILHKAVLSWNSFYAGAKDYPIIDDGGDQLHFSADAMPSDICGNGPVTIAQTPQTAPSTVAGSPTPTPVTPARNLIRADNGEFLGPIVIYKQKKWKYSADAIAMTSVCPKPGGNIAQFNMAVMEINYLHFFGNSQKRPDLESVFLHELGHLIGLGHSCQNSDTEKQGIPRCGGPEMVQDYKDAVMFPVFNFTSGGVGEVKNKLMKNDQSRSLCLY